MNLNRIKTLVEQKKYDEALASCENILQEMPEKKADILRVRASIFSRSGNYERALQDREELLEMSECGISDYYLAADNALSAQKYAKACSWLNNVLKLGEEQKDTWFNSGAYFLLAYAKMELGQYIPAITDLDRAVSIESDVGMPLPGMCGICSHQQLREEILRRGNGRDR